MKTYDYFLYVVSSLPQSVCVGYVDNTLPLVAMHHMILRVRRKIFEITTKPNNHVHCIIMLSKLACVPASSFSPLSVLSPDTLARARGMSEIVFYKWPENVLGMG